MTVGTQTKPLSPLLRSLANEQLVTIPFTFELQVTEEPEREPSEPTVENIAMLGSAWSIWWSLFALDVAAPYASQHQGRPQRTFGRKLNPSAKRPREGEALVIMHPADIAGLNAAGASAYLNPPIAPPLDKVARDFDMSGEPSLGDVVYRSRRPGPDEVLAYALAAGLDEVKHGQELFCVGIPRTTWNRRYDGRLPFEEVTFEIAFTECTFQTGSLRTIGAGIISFALTAVCVPLVIHSTAPFVDEIVAQGAQRHDISTRIKTLPDFQSAKDCLNKGYISLDTTDLVAKVSAGLQGNDRFAVCLRQEAFYALDYDPGRLDGYVGPKTRAAMEHFRNDWHLQNVPENSPEYVHTMIKALQGHSKPKG